MYRVQGLGFRVWGLGFRVGGLGFRVSGFVSQISVASGLPASVFGLAAALRLV